MCQWNTRTGAAQVTCLVRSTSARCVVPSADPSGQSWCLGWMWRRQPHTVCALWHTIPPQGAVTGSSPIWRCRVGLSKPSRSSCWATARPGSGSWRPKHVPGAVQMVDLSHAKEQVWAVAHAVFRGAPTAATAWATTACSLLEEGQMADLVSAMAALPPIPPEPGQARSIPERAERAERPRSPVFRAQGMHSGSGIAEAACTTIVSTRVTRSGMRLVSRRSRCALPAADFRSQRSRRLALEARVCRLIASNQFTHPRTWAVTTTE